MSWQKTARAGMVSIIILSVLLSACSKDPPRDIKNVCRIFKEYPSWYWAAQAARHKWGVPISVQMAIIYQESRFRGDAQPPHRKLLGVIPWFRPTSARGYTQALNQTWRLYIHDTGKRSGRRNDFATAVDFIGWYVRLAHRKLGISENNAMQMYLAYHEGILGYRRRTYLKKPRLVAIARHVQQMAQLYRTQLVHCARSLPHQSWWRSIL